MEHTEELVTTRERTRIARDIHDVLAHSLTVLSIQVQAARQLVHQDPDRLSAKLNEMAVLLRESTAESRRVVGLLREGGNSFHAHSDIGTQLHTAVERFSDRTGIHCIFEEKGIQQSLGDEQAKTLRYAVQEAMTNAHRHGAAHTIWTELCWQDMVVTLHIRDDGQGQKEVRHETHTHGHHGLQGMHERMMALGGNLQAGTRECGGFALTLSLPLRKVQTFPTQEIAHE
jgi:signal transduction histidine kinase